jgi:PhnB protein
MPSGAGLKMSEDDLNKIMHISLPISKEPAIYGSDTGEEWSAGFKQGNNFSISINTNKREEADRLFNALSNQGKIGMSMAETFWGSYFGTCTDSFGINWMISVEVVKK